MRRRNFVMSVLAGGVTAVPALAAQDHDHPEAPTGPLANATVSFGEWHTSPPLDRFLVATPPPANVHQVIPFEAQIKAGGSVNFIISGFHVLAVYAPGTELEDINSSITIAIPGAPMGVPPVINDSANRVYRGVNPFDLAATKFGPPLDRTEAINFAEPGRYLVVCVFQPHFNERMHGYVNVIK